MNALTENVQTIMINGHPAFAVIPYEEYARMLSKLESSKISGLAPDEIPHDVARLVLEKNYSIVKAWRIYLGMKQAEASAKVGITQAALSQIEKNSENKPSTLKKIASAWGLYPAQMSL